MFKWQEVKNNWEEVLIIENKRRVDSMSPEILRGDGI